MNKKDNKIWPYSILIAILLVVFAGAATIVISAKLPVQDSDTYMMGYHEADSKANELIEAKIAFDKRYNLEFLSDTLDMENTTLSYRVTDKNMKVIDNAKIVVVVTRPNTHKYDFELNKPELLNGIYIFKDIKLPVEGRWDIMAKVNVDNNTRYYNAKMDTRSKGAYEY